MSCRTTQGGTLMTRLGRATSGLSDKKITSLFHALKREGDLLDEPSKEDVENWRGETREMLDELELTPSMLERSERDLFLAKDEEYDGPTFHALQNIAARARQESVIISVKSAVADLSDPGEQSSEYQLDENGSPKYVWYASYGSNLNESRFLTYIQGGSPDGTDSEHAGARDKTAPIDSTPIRFEGRMHFAGTSYKWGRGGIAFIDKDTSGHALGRAYLITFEQFEDVVAQENGKNPGGTEIAGAEVLAKGSMEVGGGLYNNLIHIGDYKGRPVFTFTSSFSAAEAISNSQVSGSLRKYGSTNKPSNNYVKMIGKGLEESFGMDIDEQADYIKGTLGAGSIPKGELVNILSTPAEIIEKPKAWKESPSRKRRSLHDSSDWAEMDYGYGYGRGGRDSYREDTTWPPKREYVPWWEEEDTQSSSDKYYDTLLDEPSYDESDTLSIYDDNMYRSIDEIPMAFKNADGSIRQDVDFENYCGVCEKFGHDVYSCPHF